MRKISSVKSFVFFSQTGCLLPLLLTLNTLFGWIFFSPAHWLFTQAILVLLFLLNFLIFSRKVISVSAKHDNVIDTEGEVIKEDKDNQQKRISQTKRALKNS
jgi:uncharacterized membrane protein